MTIDQFNLLSVHEKYDLVFTEGSFIEYWINGNQRFILYSIYLFYVEVEYDALENKIMNLISFDEGVLLDKYAFFRNEE